MAEKLCPPLPQEIWHKVLENLWDDNPEPWVASYALPTAWISCRAVSTAFKNAIEFIFKTKYLPNTKIEIHLGEHYNDEGRVVNLDAIFEYSHLEDGDSQAVFKLKSPLEYKQLMCKPLRMYTMKTAVESPRHYVRVNSTLNDTPIPRMEVNHHILEIRSDWRSLYNHFFGEEMLYNRYRDAWVVQNSGDAYQPWEVQDRNETSRFQFNERFTKRFEDASIYCRKRARRVRILRQFQQNPAYAAFTIEENGFIAVNEWFLVSRMMRARGCPSYRDIPPRGTEDLDEYDEHDLAYDDLADDYNHALSGAEFLDSDTD